MDLTGRQYRMLAEALLDGFSYRQLEQMLYLSMDLRLERISYGEDLRRVVFDLIEYCSMRDLINDLVLAAREYNPSNMKLYAIAESLGLTTEVAVDGAKGDTMQLEQIVHQSDEFVDAAKFREGLLRLQAYMCRIEYETVLGSGFLVGPDTILTNFHVVERFLRNEVRDLRVRFDVERLTQSKRGFGGLIEIDRVVAASPPAPTDLIGDQTAVPGPDKLDFAVLRLTRPVGEQVIEDEMRTQYESRIRGWAELDTGSILQPGSVLLLPTYEHDSLKLIGETNAEISYVRFAENRTRIRYHLTTSAAIGGSPLLNTDFRVVGLHQVCGNEQACQGIPIKAIVDYVEQQGKGWVFAPPSSD